MFIVIKSEHYDCTNLICKKDTLEEAVAAVKDSMAQRINKRLASKSENTVEFVENTIVSHNKQELDVVASGMEAMGLSVETGYYDPDDESSVDVPKQLIGFHYVVLKKKV